MIKRAGALASCVLALSLSLSAQEPRDATQRISLYDSFSYRASESLLFRTSPIGLVDGRSFAPSSAIGSMGMVSLDFAPIAWSAPSRRLTRVQAAENNGSTLAALDLSMDRIYTGGEVGAMYGRSSGKYGREEFQSYILGTIGNDHFQLTVGSSYQESSQRFSRPRH